MSPLTNEFRYIVVIHVKEDDDDDDDKDDGLLLLGLRVCHWLYHGCLHVVLVVCRSIIYNSFRRDSR